MRRDPSASAPDLPRRSILVILATTLTVLVAITVAVRVADRSDDVAAEVDGMEAQPQPGPHAGPPVPVELADVPTDVDISVTGPHRSRAEGLPPSSAHEPTGNFRVTCELSHLGHWDPIVAPGNPRFSHLHMFWGNTEADHDSTYESLRSSGGGTCTGGPLNRTAYWMPAVFDSNGEVVVPRHLIAYYKAEVGSDLDSYDEVVAYLATTQGYPNGFRYIAGADVATGRGGFFDWYCEGAEEKGRTIPEDGCPKGADLVASVRFPYCWDGMNLDSPDHRSHVSFGVGDSAWTVCPDSHPVLLPSLTEIATFPWAPDIGGWYLSSDRMHEDPDAWAPNGSTWHADWFGAWDTEIQDTWLRECLLGLRNATEELCDGTRLEGREHYTGPDRIAGWTPAPGP